MQLYIKMEKCFYCKQKFDWNPKYILREHGSLGYENLDFCSKECLKEYINKGKKKWWKK